MSINRVVLVGRLTADIDLRKSQNDKSFTQFNLAVNRSFKTPGQPEADFIRCKAFGKTAELLGQYCSKGSQIGVEGRIQTGSYENNGQKVFTTDVAVDSITFLGKSEQQDQGVQTQQQNRGVYQNQTPIQNHQAQQQNDYDLGQNQLDIQSDDLPF